MIINDDTLSMPRGWIVCYKDGTVITEYDRNGQAREWKKVPKVGIKSLTLKWSQHKQWTVSGKGPFIQFKTGYISPGMATPGVKDRCIGYWEEDGTKVIYRVDEATGKMQI